MRQREVGVRGSPIAINLGKVPRPQHMAETRGAPPPPRHQRSIPYKELSGSTHPPSGVTQIPWEGPWQPLRAYP